MKNNETEVLNNVTLDNFAEATAMLLESETMDEIIQKHPTYILLLTVITHDLWENLCKIKGLGEKIDGN